MVDSAVYKQSLLNFLNFFICITVACKTMGMILHG